jgi:hypothetical protein
LRIANHIIRIINREVPVPLDASAAFAAFPANCEAVMSFVVWVVLESGLTVPKVFGRYDDAMKYMQIAKNAFDNGDEFDTHEELVKDYAVIRVATDDIRGAVEQVKKGEGDIVRNLEKDREAKQASLEAQQASLAKMKADWQELLDLI